MTPYKWLVTDFKTFEEELSNMPACFDVRFTRGFGAYAHCYLMTVEKHRCLTAGGHTSFLGALQDQKQFTIIRAVEERGDAFELEEIVNNYISRPE